MGGGGGEDKLYLHMVSIGMAYYWKDINGSEIWGAYFLGGLLGGLLSEFYGIVKNVKGHH